MKNEIKEYLKEFRNDFQTWISTNEVTAGIEQYATIIDNAIKAKYEPQIPKKEGKVLDIPIENIVITWADVVNISYNELLSESRALPVSTYRQMIQHFLWENKIHFGFTLKGIGKATKRYHATVLNSHKNIQNLLDTEPKTRVQYKFFISELKQKLNIQ